MSKRILVVDDAIFMRNIIKDILAEEGYSIVGEAGNGEEAIEKCKALIPDIVTMDIVMPVMSGIDAVREIKKLNRNIKIVMCSALGQESLVMEAIEAGASDFITKPFKKERVIEILKKLNSG